jgi:DNA-binding CsgD family transcriptional regulator
MSALLRMLYGLSPAETETVRHLLDGLGTQEVARRRRVSPETVRTQIKVVCAKLGVRGQAGLFALVNSLG